MNTDEKESEYWRQVSRNILKQHLAKQYLNGTAKNIIFFLGDGMSIPTITAARIYAGQLNGQSGEEAKLSFEKFPFTGLAKVNIETILIPLFQFASIFRYPKKKCPHIF